MPASEPSEIIGVRGEGNVTGLYVDGEFLQLFPQQTIGEQTPIPHGATSVGSIDLHSQSLLTAFVLNPSLKDASYDHPELGEMLFDSTLYARDTATDQENFLERLVRHQVGVPDQGIVADGMLDRFCTDLETLNQAGGLTMNDGNTLDPSSRKLSQTLIAFSMQMYYENPEATDPGKNLFTDVSAYGGTNGIQFDLQDVAPTLAEAKGYQLYFQDFIYQGTFTDGERSVINTQLADMRDWYIQAGTEGMTVTDAYGRGAFMLSRLGSSQMTGGAGNDLIMAGSGDDELYGGGGNDTLFGGEGMDLLVGGDGDDTLYGSNGPAINDEVPDLMAGGLGNDTYYAGFGDVIDDTEGTNEIFYDGQSTAGTYVRIDNTNIYQQEYGERRLWVDDDGVAHIMGSYVEINNFDAANYGITLSEPTVPPTDPILGTTGDDYLTDTAGSDVIYADAGNDTVDAAAGGGDVIHGDDGNDRLQSGSGDDTLYGGLGDDILLSYEGNDVVFGEDGRDVIIGDWDNAIGRNIITAYYGDYVPGNDFLYGGAEQDIIAGGALEDVLQGGGGDDLLVGGMGADVVDGGTGNDLIFGDGQFGVVGTDWSLTLTQNPDNTISLDYTGISDLDEHGGESGMENDIIRAGDGYDVVYGAYGDDWIDGGEGSDMLSGGEGNDEIHGGGGDDTIFGWNSNSTALDDDDVLFGDAGNDYIEGGVDAGTVTDGLRR